MTTISQCLECGADLSSTEAGGLCPKCILKLGLASQLVSGTLPVLAPGLEEGGAVLEPFSFGPYRILRLLGKGGMGAVYEAEHQESQRRVALKVLGHTLDTADMRARFIREGQIAASINHPNIVGVFQAEEIELTPVIAMELVLDGTLKDRVKRKGPLPQAEAVDLTLQMIDGLEAAHAAGVLHRDIKPANCFLTPEGVVKVGDFGLSISTLARAEAELTSSGAVLGTPAFAAPEQLRGREIDLRADIYAVGATLYFLLTGKATHDAESLVSLIAAVLEQPPADPRGLRPDLPPGLSRVVMRCLSKDPAARFPTYDEFRHALLPYASSAPTTATLGMRFLAGVIDCGVAATPALIFMVALGNTPLDAALVERTWGAVFVAGLFAAMQVLYFALPEGLWGASLGKMLCGLRVTSTGTNPPGVTRCLARAALFTLPELLGAMAAAWAFTSLEYERVLARLDFTWPDALSLLFLGLLFITMRRRNGFAAVQDLLTGTRVVARPEKEARVPLELNVTAAPVIGAERIGPYAVVERHGALLEAWDDLLNRRVWIRRCTAGAPGITEVRRDLARATRLRWLTGKHAGEECWDAFEKVEGKPLTVFLDGGQDWAQVRFWLLDLAEELHAGQTDGSLPSVLGPQHVWITRSGRAVLLDFPAPDAPPAKVSDVRNGTEPVAFLHRIAVAACGPRLPLHAREFITTLGAGRLETPAVAAANLRTLVQRAATFPVRRRLLTLALPALISLAGALVIAFTYGLVNRQFDQMWAREYPGRPSLRQVLDLSSWDPAMSAERYQRLVWYVGSHYRDVVRNPAFWSKPQTIAAFNPAMRRMAETAVESEPQLSPKDLARLDARVLEDVAKQAEFERWMAWLMIPSVFLMLLGIVLVSGALWTLIGRVPFALHLAGAALVKDDGAPATRARAFLRSLPVLASGVIAIAGVVILDFGSYVALGFAMQLLAALLFAIGAIWAVRRPERGLPDRIAGTYLVPR